MILILLILVINLWCLNLQRLFFIFLILFSENNETRYEGKKSS